MLITSIMIFWNGSLNYKEQLRQRDWKTTTATVTFVEEEAVDFSSPGKRNRDTTIYNIHYDYVIDGQIYSGIIDGVHFSPNIGDSLDIKYDPNAPDKSTHILEQDKWFIGIGSIFGVLAIVLIVSSILLKKKYCKKGTTEQQQEHSKETYDDEQF